MYLQETFICVNNFNHWSFQHADDISYTYCQHKPQRNKTDIVSVTSHYGYQKNNIRVSG